MDKCKCGHPACWEDKGDKCVTEGLTNEQWHDSLPYYRHKMIIFREDLDSVKEDRHSYMVENAELRRELVFKKDMQKNIDTLMGKVHNRRGAIEMAHMDEAPIVPEVKTFAGGVTEMRCLENVEWGYDSCVKSDMAFSFINNIATVTFARGYSTEIVVVDMNRGNVIGHASF
jgi:hypothetical protein